MMLRCLECDSEQLHENEATGEIICSECGTGTGRFHGITQSQVFMETRGLRVVGGATRKQHTQDPVIDVGSNQQSQEPNLSNIPINSIDESTSAVVIAADTVDASSAPVAEHKTVEQGASRSSSDVDGDETTTRTHRTQKPKRTLRPWRLSEPFTFLMRQQSIEFAQLTALPAARESHFVDTVWRLWLNYLAITGELGERAWRLASVGPGHAMCSLLRLQELSRSQRRGAATSRSNQTTRRPSGTRNSVVKNKSDVVHQDWQIVQRRMDHFLWVGWGSLYEPNEGREDIDPFLRCLQRAHAASMSKLRKRRAVTKRKKSTGATSISLNASDDLIETEDEGDDWLSAVELEPIDSLKDEAVIQLMGTNPDPNSPGLDKESPQAIWQNYVVLKLSQSQPWKRTFWRGQTADLISRALVEYNLAILFFAYLTEIPVRPAVNPISWPHADVAFLSSGLIAFTQMVTLQDIAELGNTGKLTLSVFGSWLPRGVFTAYDHSLRSLLKGRSSVSIEHLTSAAVRLTHFFGLYQLPKFPLCWLVQRFLITLGLPDATYNVSRLLIKHFSLRLQRCTNFLTGPTLISSIPWTRLLRVEVIAMAVVVITLRLLFKFNDAYEHQLSKVFRQLLIQSIDPVTAGISGSRLLFDWVAWARYITKRFHVSSAPPSQANSAVLECNASNSSQRSDLPPVFRASSDDLDRLDNVHDFLGSTEFELGKSVGWGEDNMRQRKHAQADDKISMSKPIRELLNKSSNTPNQNKNTVNSDNSASLPKPFFLTPSIVEGSYSAFRQTSLDFLINPSFDWAPYLGTSSSSAPSAEDRFIALECWKDLISRRSDYYTICTGRWSVSSSGWWARKHRDRLDKELVLPESVRRLIDMHDEALASAFEPSDAENETLSDLSANSAPQNASDVNSKQLGVNIEPSASIQWLVDVCSIVCGAANNRHLVREINSIEKLLFSDQHGRDKVFLSDLALFSCLDLHDQPR